METHNIATTPFGGRAMSLALLAGYKQADGIPEGKAVDKWAVYRNLCEAKAIIGVSDRSLAILHALLSFYPEAELSDECGLRSEEHTSELQSLMRISYAVFCLKKKNNHTSLY